MMLPKNYLEFKSFLLLRTPPLNWPDDLKSLWFAANNNWEASHQIAQDLNTEIGGWIHAYLHRIEGDKFNASYWYRSVNKAYPKISFEDELKEIIEVVLLKIY